MHICQLRLYISKCTRNPHLACGERFPSNYKHYKLGTKNSLIFHPGAANIVSLLKYAVLPAGYTVIVEYIASFNPPTSSGMFENATEICGELLASGLAQAYQT